METTTNKTIKDLLLQNIPLFFAVVITIANLYIASLLSPLKADISAVAGRVDEIEEHGTIQAQLSAQDVRQIKESVAEIKADVKEVNQKVDRLVERTR